MTLDLSTILSTFGVVFVAELPDKTALASLMLATRLPPRQVVVGASFLVVFAAEWGDLTQLATAGLVAHTSEPLEVGLGAHRHFHHRLSYSSDLEHPTKPRTRGVVRCFTRAA